MKLNETYTLSNGVQIPAIGLGTWLIEDKNTAKAVSSAIAIGYRHIDTAEAYGNESGVGIGVRQSGIPRNELFITTKLAAEFKNYREATLAIDDSLKKLNTDYVDLMIIHAPQPWSDFRGGNYRSGNREAWRALEDAYTEGKIRAIGVSNFLKEDIENLLPVCKVKPMVNQILLHISNTPEELVSYCKSQDILIESYSPIAHGQILRHPDIINMAEKYGVTVPQLCIRYTLELGTVSLPKTENIEHMRENASVDFVISEEDMKILRNLPHIENYGEYSYFPVFSGK